jgi:hypothetical protein
MRTVTFKNTPEHRNIIIDAVFSQIQPFDSVQIMRYIAENEIQGQTFDHHDISFYLDEMDTKGLIRRSQEASYFVKYEINR